MVCQAWLFLFVGGEFLANAGKVSLKLAKGVFLQ